jgi:DNA-binding Lrp family transcriptional regulator
MDAIDRDIINGLQGGLPIAERPYREAAQRIGIDEADLIDRLQRMLAEGTLSRFGPLYDAEKMGGAVTLAAMAVPADRFADAVEIVNGFPEVAHNYERDHRLNMWFVVNAERAERIGDVLAAIEQAAGLPVLNMPKLDEYFLELRLQA